MKKFLFLGFFAILFGIGAFFFTSSKKGPSPLPDSSVWKFISPGKTTTQEILQGLGSPLSSSSSGDTTILSYPTNNQYWNNEIVTTKNVVHFVKERFFPIQEGSFSQKQQSLSSAPVQLFGPDSKYGIFLFVYVDKGTALLAKPKADTIYEQWYFAPTTLASFLLSPELEWFSLTPQAVGSDSGL